MKNIILLVGVLFVILVGCKEDNPVETTPKIEINPVGSFSGYVFDVQGSKLQNVQITTVPKTYVLTTTYNGEYRLNNIPTGFYKLYAKLDGYYDSDADMVINDGKEFIQNFVMEKIPPEPIVYDLTGYWNWFPHPDYHSLQFKNLTKAYNASDLYKGDAAVSVRYYGTSYRTINSTVINRHIGQIFCIL